MEWNASSELIAEIGASIVPVRTEAALRKVLAEDFPRDCSDLPISGGWGYTQGDAITFILDQFPIPKIVNFVSLEYHIVQKIIYEELIVFRPKDYRFAGIQVKLDTQRMEEIDHKKYDILNFVVICWSDWHFEQLKKEWEENLSGTHPDFDAEAHDAKRIASQIRYEREFWFDVSDVFNRAVSSPPIPTVS
jgi:hypothetical protein